MSSSNAWIKLISGAAVVALGVYQTTIGISGASQEKAIQAGIIAFAGCIFHSLADGPTDATPTPPKPTNP